MDAKEVPVRPGLEQYKTQAKELVKRVDLADPEALRRIRRNHQKPQFALSDAQFVMAREHGFDSWPKFAKHVEALAQTNSPVSTFEAAVEAVVNGDIETLDSLVREHPDLVRARSTREHRAALLHYVSANGVEGYRQKSAKNAALVADLLLKAGAPVDALADTYMGGAQQTTLNLVVSSVHPARAGVQVALVNTLADYGSAVNGLENDGSPLRTALQFHYAEAAEALVSRGARVDTIDAAAGLGREDLVERFLREGAQLEPALILAAMHGRVQVIEQLLQRGADVAASDPREFTSLHWAGFYGYPEAVELLLKWRAPLEVENEFGGTPLNQVIWTGVHERLLPEHVQIMQTLLKAGAKVDAGWFAADMLPERIAKVLQGGRA